jgi:hypothetical protein
MKISSSIYKLCILLLALLILPALVQSQDGHKKTSLFGKFSIVFPGEPDYSVEDVETEVGTLEMHTYLYEESDNVAYMVAYIDYPEDMVQESDNDVLLNAALEGALGSWGIDSEKVKKEVTWHSGHKGIFTKESSGDTYTAYEVLMVGNRLYQIAILKYGKAIGKKELKAFYDSFELKL